MWLVTQLVLFKPSTSACIRFNFFSVVINSDYGLHNWILVTIAINPGCSIAVNMKDVEVNGEKKKSLQNLKNLKTNPDSFISGAFYAFRDH